MESSQTFPTSTVTLIMYYAPSDFLIDKPNLFPWQRQSIPLTSKHQGQCVLRRLARHRWRDHILSILGWYPWQCHTDAIGLPIFASAFDRPKEKQFPFTAVWILANLIVLLVGSPFLESSSTRDGFQRLESHA